MSNSAMLALRIPEDQQIGPCPGLISYKYMKALYTFIITPSFWGDVKNYHFKSYI